MLSSVQGKSECEVWNRTKTVDVEQMIVFLGGVFDPPHFGHIKPVVNLAQRSDINQVRLLPCCQPPHKQVLTSTAHRLAMLMLIEQPPKIIVDTYEIERQTVSYTIDSLTYFRQCAGGDKSLAFAMGADAFMEIASWKNYSQLLKVAHLIVMARPDYVIDDNHILLQNSGGWSPLSVLTHAPAGQIALFEDEQWDLSSSQIRELLVRGEQPRYLLPGVVWNYICRHQLYGYHAAA